MNKYTPCPNCEKQPALTIITSSEDVIIFCTCGVAGPRGTRTQAEQGWAKLAGLKKQEQVATICERALIDIIDLGSESEAYEIAIRALANTVQFFEPRALEETA